jgi:16S rRNA (guanine527-N7)-methyltransferase
LTPDTIAAILQPYLAVPAAQPEDGFILSPDWPGVFAQLAAYLDLILRWNARINLTAIRDPEEIVRRHFGESLFVGTQLGYCPTLLDFGSGAGFPGLPIQLMRPDIRVTLAESRSRKAAFLHEAVRSMRLSATIWPSRVEDMPSIQRFHTVALRAVDDMDAALPQAASRTANRLLIMGTRRQLVYPVLTDGFRMAPPIAVSESKEEVLLVANRL